MINFAAKGDWFSPLWAYIQDWHNGPTFRFCVPAECIIYIDMLKQHGIKTWGVDFNQSVCLCSVMESEAERAIFLLATWGVPVLDGEE